MRDPAVRLLTLLSLLESRPDWTGSELADRLGVSARTVRTDISRLRELGYPVDAVQGAGGHYRLGVGAALPPLLLDDEEAVAIAVGLRSGAGISGIRDSSTRALAKLERVLPHRLRRSVAAISATISHGPENTSTDAPDPEVDPALLSTLAAAIRDRISLRFDYHEPGRDGGPAGAGPAGQIEPHRLVSWQRRWYLVGREPARGDWHVLRIDWITLRTPAGPRFTPTPPPADYTDLVLREVASTGWKVHARIAVAAPAETVLARINPAVGVVETVDEHNCVLVTGADSLATVAAYVGMLELDFRIAEPSALVDHVRRLGERYLRATAPAATDAIREDDRVQIGPHRAGGVRELRLAVTAADWEAAVTFYRDELGLPQVDDFSSDRGRVVLLDAGRATLELVDPDQAAFIDEVEVGRRVAGHIRLAFEVDDVDAGVVRLASAGAEVIAGPTRTPWNSRNARLEAPAGLQLTLFEEPTH